jgi:8-oxo-dGTP pyrophosphatase MutT (NUDIX family)
MQQQLPIQSIITQMRESGKETFARTMSEGLPRIDVKVIEERKVGRLTIQEVEGIVNHVPIMWTQITAPNGGINALPMLRIDSEEYYILTFKPQIPAKSFTYELIGGYGKPGESPKETANREIREETGFLVKDLSIISPSIYNFPGRLAWGDVTFEAEGLTYLGKTGKDPVESHMKIILMTPKEVMIVLLNHQVLSSLSAATLHEHFLLKYFGHTKEFKDLLR